MSRRYLWKNETDTFNGVLKMTERLSDRWRRLAELILRRSGPGDEIATLKECADEYDKAHPEIEPGQHICNVHCPNCWHGLEVVHGEEPGEFGTLSNGPGATLEAAGTVRAVYPHSVFAEGSILRDTGNRVGYLFFSGFLGEWESGLAEELDTEKEYRLEIKLVPVNS